MLMIGLIFLNFKNENVKIKKINFFTYPLENSVKGIC